MQIHTFVFVYHVDIKNFGTKAFSEIFKVMEQNYAPHTHSEIFNFFTKFPDNKTKLR